MQAYRIHRLDNSATAYHDRRRSSVERHLANAPAPPGRGAKRYPKEHYHTERQYKTKSKLYEYPTKDYPYSNQNAKGIARRTSPGGTTTVVDPEYTRTITDSHKNIQGVSYHPYNNRKKHVRAQEIYVPRKGRR